MSIQETHLTPECEFVFKAVYSNNDILFSLGTNNSRGVCVVWKRNSGVSCKNIHSDNDGRVLIMKVIIGNKVFYIINIYAPNSISDRVSFYKQLFETITLLHIKNDIIIARDFNTALGVRDRKGGGF